MENGKSIVKDEIAFVIERIKKCKENEAAWAYLRGYLKCKKSKNPNI